MQAGIKTAAIAVGAMLALSCQAWAQEEVFHPETAVAQAVALVRPSVVAIETRFTGALLEDKYAFWQYFRGARPLHGLWGSGFVYKDPNYVVTSAFLMENAEFIRVILDDNRSYRAELVDTDDVLGVAVLKVDWGQDFVPASPPFGSSASLVLGQPIAVVGKALNSIDTYTSFGVISAIRKITPGTKEPTEPFLQFDASYELSFIGGPLVDINGRVVGLIRRTVQDTTVTNINLAVPVDDVLFAADAIISGTNIEVVFGGELVELRQIQQQQGMAPTAFDVNGDGKAEALETGMLVTYVDTATPADLAGLKRGDILLSVDGHQLKFEYDWVALRRTFEAGQIVLLTVLRKGLGGDWQKLDLQCQILANIEEAEEEDSAGESGNGSGGARYHKRSLHRLGGRH
jgi:S1-C subfamily serine protease